MSSNSNDGISSSTTTTTNTIYLVRHGESMGNVERIFLPAEDDVLSTNGKKQVELLGKHLAEIKFSRMYSSDYSRAVDTAKVIHSESKYSSTVELQLDARLRERSYGILEGHPYKEGFKQLQLSNVPILEFEISEGEKVSDIVLRMGSFMQELCDDLDESEESENILIVSHSFAIVSFLCWLSQSENYKMINWDIKKDFKMLGNGSYMKIEIEKKIGLQMSPRELNFLSINECSHLETLNTSGGSFSSFIDKTDEAKNYSGCVQQ